MLYLYLRPKDVKINEKTDEDELDKRMMSM